jgi:hypothetical protein
MKTVTQTFAIILISLISLNTFAGSGNLPLDESNPLKAVTLDVERVNGEVTLNLNAQETDKYKSIIIERSASEIDAFAQVCVITADELTGMSSVGIEKVDKYPINAQSTSFYRVKAVETSGVIRMFPAVQLYSLSASK